MFYVSKHYILYLAPMPYRNVLGLYMVVSGTQNSADEGIKSCIAGIWAFRYPGDFKNHRAVIVLAGLRAPACPDQNQVRTR